MSAAIPSSHPARAPGPRNRTLSSGRTQPEWSGDIACPWFHHPFVSTSAQVIRADPAYIHSGTLTMFLCVLLGCFFRRLRREYPPQQALFHAKPKLHLKDILAVPQPPAVGAGQLR